MLNVGDNAQQTAIPTPQASPATVQDEFIFHVIILDPDAPANPHAGQAWTGFIRSGYGYWESGRAWEEVLYNLAVDLAPVEYIPQRVFGTSGIPNPDGLLYEPAEDSADPALAGCPPPRNVKNITLAKDAMFWRKLNTNRCPTVAITLRVAGLEEPAGVFTGPDAVLNWLQIWDTYDAKQRIVYPNMWSDNEDSYRTARPLVDIDQHRDAIFQTDRSILRIRRHRKFLLERACKRFDGFQTIRVDPASVTFRMPMENGRYNGKGDVKPLPEVDEEGEEALEVEVDGDGNAMVVVPA